MKLWNIAVNLGSAGSRWEQQPADRVEVMPHGELVGYQLRRVVSTFDGTTIIDSWDVIWTYAPGVWAAAHPTDPVKEERLVS